MSKIKKIIILPIIMVIMIPLIFQVITFAATTTTWKDTETNIEFDITINDDGTTSVSPKNITPAQANLALVEAQKRAEAKAQELVEEKNSNGNSSITTGSITTTEETGRESLINQTFSVGDLKGIDLTTLAKSQELFCSQKGGLLPGEGWYTFEMGGQTFYAGKNPTGDITSGVRATVKDQTATTYTACDYKVVDKISINTENSSKYADVAYIATFYKDNVGSPNNWSGSGIPETQTALWTTEINSGITQNVSSDLATEASKYKEFVTAYETFASSNNNNPLKYVIKDKTASAEVDNKIIWLGPYEVDYVRGFAKVGSREKVDFGGISGATLYNQDGKVLSTDAWEIVTEDEKEGKKRSRVGEGDEDYKYPYPTEPFYVKVYADKLSSADAQATTALSKMSFSYSKLDVQAEIEKLEGECYEVKWTGKVRREMCTKGYKMTNPTAPGMYMSIYCEHGFDQPHTYEGNPYIKMTKEKNPDRSQDMIRIRKVEQYIPVQDVTIPMSIPYRLSIPDSWIPWPIWPDYPDYPDRPDGDLTYTIAGFVWEDKKTGKESVYDGIMTTGEELESGIKNVEVVLYNHNTGAELKSTYTDSNGAYVFNEVPIGTYDVGFVYDGMTYTTTHAFGGDTASSYLQNPNDEKYHLTSKAEEDPNERQEFNDQFEVINEYGSNKYLLGEDGIKYETANGKSILQTTYSDGKVREPFQLETKTSNTITVGYPLTNYTNNATTSKTINGQEYLASYTYMAYINLGLRKRDPVDFALTKDVSTTTLTVNGKKMIYEYNVRNEDSFEIEWKNQITYRNQLYNRALYTTDFTYRIDAYDNSLGTVDAASVRGLKSEKQELRVFVTYKVKILNQSVIYSGTINELVDYFDSEYTLIKEDEKLDIRDEDGNWHNDQIVAEAPYYSKDGKTITGDLKIKEVDSDYKGYNKIRISGIENDILQSGESVYLYLTFEVNKDKVTRTLDTDDKANDGKNNYVEISSYSTYDALAASKTYTVGMIDRDSAPGNLIPDNDTTIEDDSDKAPPIRIYEAKPESRRISGYVWEDERNATAISSNSYSTGDGIRTDDEDKINDVVVQLVEIITDTNGNKVGEYIWQEMRSGDDVCRYMDISGKITDANYGEEDYLDIEAEAGKYIFTDFVPGDYVVRFKYGTDERTIDPDRNLGKSYNGQDYKSTVYLLGDDVDREWYDLESDYLKEHKFSDARDIEERRLEVINYSKTVNFKIAEVLNSVDSETRNRNLWDELAENTEMTAQTAKMRIEVERATTRTSGMNEELQTTYQIENIDFGIVERPKVDIEVNKEIEWIKVTLADGTTLIDTEAGIKRNVNWVSNRIVGNQFRKGAIHIYMDEEVEQGANVQIKYKITIKNNSELDYTGYGNVGSAYYTGYMGADDHVVTTKIDFLADYVDDALVYRTEENAMEKWKTLDQFGELQSLDNMSGKYIDDELVETIKQNINQILVNDSILSNSTSKAELAPNDTATVYLTLTKTLSSSSEEDPTFNNIAEILQYTNEVGRRSEIPGDQDPTKTPTVGYNDSDCAETITITPPTGENRAHYYVLATAVLAILVTGIVLIKKKVLDK